MQFIPGKLYRVKQNVFHSQGNGLILWTDSVAMCIDHKYFKKHTHVSKQWHWLFLNKEGHVITMSWSDNLLDTLFEGPL